VLAFSDLYPRLNHALASSSAHGQSDYNTGGLACRQVDTASPASIKSDSPEGDTEVPHSVARHGQNKVFTVPGVALGRAAPGSGARSCQQRPYTFCQTGCVPARAPRCHSAGPQIHGLQFSDCAGVSAIDVYLGVFDAGVELYCARSRNVIVIAVAYG